MTKSLSYVLLILLVLVLLNYFYTIAGNALASFSPELVPAGSAETINSPGSSGGLSEINFSFFDKGGSGKSYITQGYGDTPYSYLYVNHWHNGIDIAANYGAPVYSPGTGVVLATGDQDNYCYHLGFGKFVAVDDSANHLVLWYAHLGVIAVSPGETIQKNQEIGAIGETGLETGPHLHFSVFEENGFSMENKYGCGPDANGKDVDPLLYLGTTYQ